jgi:hypothetical protein
MILPMLVISASARVRSNFTRERTFNDPTSSLNLSVDSPPQQLPNSSTTSNKQTKEIMKGKGSVACWNSCSEAGARYSLAAGSRRARAEFFPRGCK